MTFTAGNQIQMASCIYSSVKILLISDGQTDRQTDRWLCKATGYLNV